MDGRIFGADSLAVYAMYAVSLVMLSRIYGAYRMGLAHVGELLYGQALANLISLAITYILACALARKLLNPLAGFGCAAIQALFSAGWTVAANQLYFSLHKPKRTVVIYRDESDLCKLREIRFFAERWQVERSVQWVEGNAHDLPHAGGASDAPGDIQRLMRIMENYEAVFVSGVSATLRNGIVKYCVEKDKDCYFGAAHGRRDYLGCGAHPLVLGADLPGGAVCVHAGVPVRQAGDGHRAVANCHCSDQSFYGGYGAGDPGIRSRPGAVQAGAADEGREGI